MQDERLERPGRLSPDEEKSSIEEDAMRDDTLVIVSDALRAENRQLQQNVAVLQAENQTQDKRLAQAQRRLRDLEDDVARVHRQKQQEIDTQRREWEQKLQDQLSRMHTRPAGRESPNDLNSPVLQDTREMEQFLQRFMLWQRRLVALSRQLENNVDELESQVVSSVLKDLVTQVEVDTLQDAVQDAQEELQWSSWLQEDTENCLQDVVRSREETEVFEAIEKQLTDDRVVELETQLAQKRAVEREKEMELSSLRATQDELLMSNQMTINDEFEAEKKVKDVQLTQMKHKIVTQDETIKNLQEQLQKAKMREVQMATTLKGVEKEREKSRQRKEELKILYAKFSSAMDSVSENMMRLEELEQELKDVKSNAQTVQDQKEELQKQVEQLQQEKSKDLVAQDTVKDELDQAQKQCAELKEVDYVRKELVDKMQDEITELKAQNELLREQQVKNERQSVDGRPQENANDVDNELVLQVAEKEALQIFFQRYYAAAEKKCSELLKKVSDFESQKPLIQEQIEVLRMCTQVESCEKSVRASLLDVMMALESFTNVSAHI